MERHVFDTMRNGYNRFQVDDDVQNLELQIENLTNKLEQAYKLKETHEKNAEEIQEKYDALSESIAIKEKAAYDMTRLALKEANMIVDTAHKNGDVIVRESLMMAREILSEIARLGNEANDIKGSMREEIETIRKALDEFETPQIPNMDLLKK
ncbi:MAG: DivIVA domain-containing protein [Longicatena sp.]